MIAYILAITLGAGAELAKSTMMDGIFNNDSPFLGAQYVRDIFGLPKLPNRKLADLLAKHGNVSIRILAKWTITSRDLFEHRMDNVKMVNDVTQFVSFMKGVLNTHLDETWCDVLKTIKYKNNMICYSIPNDIKVYNDCKIKVGGSFSELMSRGSIVKNVKHDVEKRMYKFVFSGFDYALPESAIDAAALTRAYSNFDFIINADAIYIALFNKSGAPGTILCYDIDSRKLRWKRAIFSLNSLIGKDTSTISHCIHLVASNRKIDIYGYNIHYLYYESYYIETGQIVAKVSTNLWSHYHLNYSD